MTVNNSVAVIGGACSGSEIAAQLAALGMNVTVFEQNPLPYGKIEDGLPRWHEKLQAKEMAAIDAKLSAENVHFVPQSKLGEDFSVRELIEEWGFSLVVMANGAWRDRPLQAEGLDQVSDLSFAYQNAFVYWFNHYPDRNYNGPAYQVTSGPVVIGGGLSSIDMVKICQFELVKKGLAERGLEADLVAMEHHGIFALLETHGLKWEDLNLEPATLVYRKRVCDMPLVPLGDDADEAKLEKAKAVREKLINNGTTRYGFRMTPLRSPVRLLTEQGSVTGIVFDVYRHENGRFLNTGEQETVKTNLVISSIGSIPEPIDGIPMKGEFYDWNNRFTGVIETLPNFYCVGNAITGRGNIRDSAKNARRLGTLVADALNGTEPDYPAWFSSRAEEARAHVEKMMHWLRQMPPTPAEVRAGIHSRIARRREAIGYLSYDQWRDRVLQERA